MSKGNRLGVSNDTTEGNAISARIPQNQEIFGSVSSRSLSPQRVESEFSLQEAQHLGRLLEVPILQPTGRQWEDLHGVYYKKHADKLTRYMSAKELVVHLRFEEMEEASKKPSSDNVVFLRAMTPIAIDTPFGADSTPIQQQQRGGLEVDKPTLCGHNLSATGGDTVYDRRICSTTATGVCTNHIGLLRL